MRIILLLLGISLAPLAMGEVYRSVDESGNVIYSDQPSPEAEKIRIDEVQTIDPGAVPAFEYTEPKAKEDKNTNRYQTLAIGYPVNDTSVRSNNGDITVEVNIQPVLKPGHVLALSLDGTEVMTGGGRTFNLTNLDRGEHTLTVAVKLPSGKELQRSPAVTFTVQRHSIQLKPSTVGKPPPPPPSPPPPAGP